MNGGLGSETAVYPDDTDMAHIGVLVGDKLTAIRVVGAAPTATRNLPWLEIEMDSGRKFVLAPNTDSVVDGVEQLSIDLQEVEIFSRSQRWPGGPEEPRSDVLALSFALSKVIASAVIESNGYAEAVLMRVWGGGSVYIRHDSALPMSLALGEAHESP